MNLSVISSRLIVLLSGLVLGGCIQFETLVTVERGGTGTVTERFVMSGEVVEMLAAMTPEGETFQIMDREQLAADAAKYGQGVTMVSAEPLETTFGQGYEVRYAFEDITQLRLDQDPRGKVPDGGGSPDTDPTYVTFEMKADNEVVVHLPLQEPDAPEAEPQPEDLGEPSAEELEMIKAMFQDMRMAIHLAVDGSITDTNATHVEGSKVILVDLSFGELVSDPDALAMMMQHEPQNLADMKKLAQTVPGLKMEFEPTVTVRFD